MITKKFYLKNNDEVIKILGPQDVYLKEMEKEFKVSIFVNHNKENESASLTIKGKQRNVDKTVNMLEYMLKKYYEKILKPAEDQEQKRQEEEEKLDKNSIYRTEFGEIIKAKTENQKNYIKTILENDIVISIGPAGTGKTFLASTVALKLLKEKKIRKIVVTRPIVESGERLGFLPGDIDDKVNPYLRPVYDTFYNLLGPEKFQIYKEEEIIETVPLAYMRGRTLENSFIILDEAQNTTTAQMKMFLTRMGNNSKIVITGDITQIDIKEKEISGLITSMEILKEIKEIKVVKLDTSDIVRHPLVAKIVTAYEKWEER
ncbi:MAG TPA: PhoH family protein [Elusimicrobiales bacterium]|nr:PhoH family protein [Elusimicrobiales bacterium]